MYNLNRLKNELIDNKLIKIKKNFLNGGIKLPLESQATTMETRLEGGIQAQVDIFGDQMRDFYKSGKEDEKHINYWLADNCFFLIDIISTCLPYIGYPRSLNALRCVNGAEKDDE